MLLCTCFKLQVAKSKTLKTWQELERRITDTANETKDNVKFLYTLKTPWVCWRLFLDSHCYQDAVSGIKQDLYSTMGGDGPG